jgi:hypothetical protein
LSARRTAEEHRLLVLRFGPGQILPIPLYKLPTPVELGLMLPFVMIAGAYGIILNLALLWTLDVFHALTMRIG